MRALLPSLHAVSLDAAPDSLLARAARRSQQWELWLPGDDLFGCDRGHLDDVVRRAATSSMTAPTSSSAPTASRPSRSARSSPTRGRPQLAPDVLGLTSCACTA